MKILFVSGVYVPASGGSEISIHTLLSELKRRGHTIRVLTGPIPSGEVGKSEVGKVRVFRVEEGKLEREFEKVLESFSPDLVMTQLMWSERILAWAKSKGFKTAYFIRSVGHELDFSEGSSLSPDLILANSSVTQDYVRNQWNRESVLVYPVIRLADYLVKKEARGKFITMFNPIKIKGGEIFKKIALREPERRFMAVEGWHHWKDPKTGKWNMQKLKSNAKAFGGKVIVPDEVEFQEVDNIRLHPATKDVRPIYKKTRLLLVPSLWQEPFARVIVEAMINGIPVICSNTGGLAKIVGKGGLVIDKYTNPQEWVKKIKFFDNEKNYESFSNMARKQATKFGHEEEVTKVEKALKRLVDKNG